MLYIVARSLHVIAILLVIAWLLSVSQHVTVRPLLVIVTSLDLFLQSLYMLLPGVSLLLPVSLHVIDRHLFVID